MFRSILILLIFTGLASCSLERKAVVWYKYRGDYPLPKPVAARLPQPAYVQARSASVDAPALAKANASEKVRPVEYIASPASQRRTFKAKRLARRVEANLSVQDTIYRYKGDKLNQAAVGSFASSMSGLAIHLGGGILAASISVPALALFALGMLALGLYITGFVLGNWYAKHHAQQVFEHRNGEERLAFWGRTIGGFVIALVIYILYLSILFVGTI